MVTVAFLGDVGTGKTTMCTRHTILTKKLHPNKRLYCNYHLSNVPYEELDLMELYLDKPEEKGLIISIDEIYTTMDSRISSSYRNRIESYFIAMTRKADADLFVTMQYETFVDCRLSPFVKVKYVMESIPLIKNIVIDGKEYEYIQPHPYLFKFTLYDERSGKLSIQEGYFDGRRWFNEFNTDQIIKPPEDVLMNIKINKMKKKVQYERLKYQCSQIDNGVNIFERKKQDKKDVIT